MDKRKDPIVTAYENLETEVNNRLKPISKWEAVNACLICLAIAAVIALVLISIKKDVTDKKVSWADKTTIGAIVERGVSL